MTVHVVSDLHIWNGQDPLNQKLIQALDRALAEDVFVLAGDIFDLFVGDKNIFKLQYAKVLAAIREAGERGVRVHYIEGNHDFLVRKIFVSMKNVVHHSYQVEFVAGGKRFLVAHGDKANSGDRGYLFLRWFFRSFCFRVFVSLMPNRAFSQFGQFLSRSSRRQHPHLFSNLPAEQQIFLRKIYRQYAEGFVQQGFDFVVLGHCHDLDESRFEKGQYINVGYPREHKTMLQWKVGDESIRRVEF